MVISELGIPGFPFDELTLAGTPALAGILPVNNPALEAEQMADGAYMFVNRMPVSARRSIVGVNKSSEP